MAISVTFLVNNEEVHTTTAPPYVFNLPDVQVGSYEVVARLTLDNGSTIDSAPHTFTVVPDEVVPEPETREYNASNAYTQLIAENFSGIGGAIPPTAVVTGAEVIVDYKMHILSRTRDRLFTDLENTNDLVALDILDNVRADVALLQKSGDNYTHLSTDSAIVGYDRQDFTVEEAAISDNKKWTVRESDEVYQAVVGGEEFLWGQDPIPFSQFLDTAIGVRFVPQVSNAPSYTAAGDAVYRFFIDRLRMRIYFDAGSPIYYFASPDKTEVIKGTLVAYCIFNGNFRTADASGTLQLLPDLEIMDGNQAWIGNDWTIHSAYPPSDNNYIGDVAEGADGSGMRYNGLPTQQDIVENRSRYEFITTNFYGDKNMNSFYGVHGLPRAFAYNKDFFYKICTQPDPVKDSPRHIANHHEHLALGYDDGRVDLSVVGEPYNFDGAMGASSWATADPVTGLLPLPGMILGIFGEKSVTGLSGTTVDNFATQLISPKMGAIEYTIADMGFPVYANHYGIYTLSQVQQYGDFMGTPLSQDISPWLRPRLVRSYTKDEEVVCAWPVRSKNQYRLAFGDGAILTMTINNGQQGSPTFSKQKYFKVPERSGQNNSVFDNGATWNEVGS